MSDTGGMVLRTMLIGGGATVLMDVWGFVRARFGGAAPNYAVIGRWLAYLMRGRWFHASIAAAPALRGERLLGWVAHYATGVAFAGALLALCGSGWARDPTLTPALLFGIGTVVVPLFIVQPAMGLGFASSRAPDPAAARLRSVVTHAVFGAGLYLAALTLRWLPLNG